jgi:hypothetical protein
MKILIQHNFSTGLGEFIRNITHYMFLLKPYKNNGYEIHLLINLRENKYVNKPFFKRLFSKDICDYFDSITETPIPIYSNEYNGFKYFMSAHEPQKPGVHQWDIFFDNIEGFDFEIPKIYSGTLIRDNLNLDTLPTFNKEITSRVNNFIENNSVNFNYLHIIFVPTKNNNTMRISTDAEGTIRVNDLTFLQFMNEFKGKIILNKRNVEVPKFILFWTGASPIKIKETFTLVNRK